MKPTVREQLITDAREVGNEAIAELAADEGATGVHHSVAELKEQANTIGYEASPSTTLMPAGARLAARSECRARPTPTRAIER